MEEGNTVPEDENCKSRGRYTFSEDMAIVKYMIADNKYLRSSGIKVWKDAEKLGICPGRPYLSMKERFRKVITKNLKQYKVEEEVAVKIMQFMKASSIGKSIIREKIAT